MNTLTDVINQYAGYIGFQVRYLDQYNNYTGEFVDFPNETLEEAMNSWMQLPASDFYEGAMFLLNDPNEETPILGWDGTAWMVW